MLRPVSPPDTGRCDAIRALDRAVRKLENARGRLAACLWAKSDDVVNSCLADLRAARAAFQQRLIEYRDHHQGCAACRPEGDAALESSPAEP